MTAREAIARVFEGVDATLHITGSDRPCAGATWRREVDRRVATLDRRRHCHPTPQRADMLHRPKAAWIRVRMGDGLYRRWDERSDGSLDAARAPRCRATPPSVSGTTAIKRGPDRRTRSRVRRRPPWRPASARIPPLAPWRSRHRLARARRELLLAPPGHRPARDARNAVAMVRRSGRASAPARGGRRLDRRAPPPCDGARVSDAHVGRRDAPEGLRSGRSSNGCSAKRSSCRGGESAPMSSGWTKVAALATAFLEGESSGHRT